MARVNQKTKTSLKGEKLWKKRADLHSGFFSPRMGKKTNERASTKIVPND